MTGLEQEARAFLKSTRSAVLSTFSKRYEGYPFGSVSPFILDQQCQPVLLISTIAEHTKNILQNPKAAMLVFSQQEDLHAGGRLTLLGEAVAADKNNTALRARYLRYFPQAEQYFAMHDFMFFTIKIEQARFIAGFGKMGWIEGLQLTLPESALASQETGIIEHMNADHKHNLINYCRQVSGQAPADAQMLGIDCDGMDIMADGVIVRVPFAQPINNAQEARTMLVQMAHAAKN